MLARPRLYLVILSNLWAHHWRKRSSTPFGFSVVAKKRQAGAWFEASSRRGRCDKRTWRLKGRCKYSSALPFLLCTSHIMLYLITLILSTQPRHKLKT
jgi:hypothetical protein